MFRPCKHLKTLQRSFQGTMNIALAGDESRFWVTWQPWTSICEEGETRG
jgi:hypothetical protein